MCTDYFVVVILQWSSLPHPPFLRSRPHSRHGTKDFSSSSSSLFFLFSNTCYDITKKKRSVKCNCFSQELKTTVFFLFPKDIIKNHKSLPLWDTNKMVGSIITLRLFYSLSLVPFVFCDDASNSFLLSFLFLCLVFARWMVWMGQTDETKFPLRVDMTLMRLKSIPDDGFHAQFKRRTRRWEHLTSLFSFVTRINSILYCLFFFIRILLLLLLLKILRLERRNECSLQSRKNSTRTSTREAWWT
jgi:hypothetical protein